MPVMHGFELYRMIPAHYRITAFRKSALEMGSIAEADEIDESDERPFRSVRASEGLKE